MHPETRSRYLNTLRNSIDTFIPIWEQLNIPHISSKACTFRENADIDSPNKLSGGLQFSVHPDLVDVIKHTIDIANERKEQLNKISSTTAVNPETGHAVFSEKIFTLNNQRELTRSVSMLFAPYVRSSRETIMHDNYLPEENTEISELLDVIFTREIPIESTKIISIGFDKYLQVEDHVVAILGYSDEHFKAGKMFDREFTIVTQLIKDCDGDINAFENQVALTRDLALLIPEDQLYKNFNLRLLQQIKLALQNDRDWQKILSAFTTNDFNICHHILKTINSGVDIYQQLSEALHEDEGFMAEVNQIGSQHIPIFNSINQRTYLRGTTNMGKN